ncbi:MAG: hypothetical protein ABIV94_11185 [Acidimicrobiales bacterium]
MQITVQYILGCPHADLAAQRVTAAAVVLGLDVPVTMQLVDDESTAALGFAGSPTILIDEADLFPAEPSGLSCRLYATDEGPQGAPSIEQAVDALRQRSMDA